MFGWLGTSGKTFMKPGNGGLPLYMRPGKPEQFYIMCLLNIEEITKLPIVKIL